MIEIFETSRHVYLVMELVTGGELFTRICREKTFSEADAARIMGDLCSGLKYLHSLGIVHRDLKVFLSIWYPIDIFTIFLFYSQKIFFSNLLRMTQSSKSLTLVSPKSWEAKVAFFTVAVALLHTLPLSWFEGTHMTRKWTCGQQGAFCTFSCQDALLFGERTLRSFLRES